jgi:hypothetical protein
MFGCGQLPGCAAQNAPESDKMSLGEGLNIEYPISGIGTEPEAFQVFRGH